VTATVWHAVAAPWQEPLTQRALVEVALVGLAGGALGCWVVLYNLSYSAESLAHGLLPGLVLAALTGLPLLLGGAVGLALAAAGIALAARAPAIGRDTAVAVVITGLFGLGALLALAPATPAGLQGLLFGDPLGVSDGDLLLATGLVAVIAGGLTVLHGRLLVVGFDRGGAAGLGVRAARVDLALLGLIALTLLVAVQGLGNLLVVALLVGPATAARRIARRVPAMLAAAAGLAALAGIAGIYISYYAHVAAGASIAVAMLATVAIAQLLPRARR
jgi:ABC-type Mn2+/Zn2+ transport system permease subunit